MSDDPDESFNDGMAIFFNPLFEEEAEEDVSKFSVLLNPLFEEDLLCNQIYQHHDNRPNDNFENEETQSMCGEVYSNNESCITSSYEPEVHKTCEDEHGFENLPSVPSD